MTKERKRASVVDVSGFTPREIDKPDADTVARVVDESPFRSRREEPVPDDGPARRGRPSRGQKGTVYARLPEERHQLLQRIRDEKGWSLVTALERAIDALASKEGID